MPPEFIFKSKFSIAIRKTFLEHEMYMIAVAEKIGCNVAMISAYYNDRKILTLKHAQEFSSLLQTLNVHYSADELMQMQKQADFIVRDKRSVAEFLGLVSESPKE